MRVLLDVSAVPKQPVGAGIYTIELARGLARTEAVDLHLLCRRNDATRWEHIAPGATVHPIVPLPRPARLLWEAQRGSAFADRLGCDVWHGPHYTLPRHLACASVVTVHDLTFFDQPETHERVKVGFFRRAINTNSERATRIICVSQHTRDRLHALVPHHAPIDIARHGIDHNRFRVDDAPANVAHDSAALARRGITGDFIAFVGTIQPRKALPILVEAFGMLRSDFPTLRLVIAGGDGWGSRALLDAIRRNQVATSVVRPGYIDDATVAALYRRAAVVAYPSLAEGFGLPALEALACGAPLVTSSGTAMDEFIDDGALTASPGSARELEGALRAALVPDTAARLRRRGPQIAAAYTWSACVDTHLSTYRAAAHSGAPPNEPSSQ